RTPSATSAAGRCPRSSARGRSSAPCAPRGRAARAARTSRPHVPKRSVERKGNMRPPAISLDQLASLPMVYRAVIPPADEDRIHHMNMRWYLALYDEAGDAMYPMLGLTADYFAASGMGGFDLEHHLWYPAEVRIGDTVVIRARILARSAKLMHYMMFM